MKITQVDTSYFTRIFVYHGTRKVPSARMVPCKNFELLLQPGRGTLDGGLDDSVGLIHGVKYMRQARVVGVDQAVLGQIERQVVDVRHVECAHGHASNGRQYGLAHLEAGHLH